ncbi:uncharacterized protein SPPG_09366 [Spizellomyces punctatus DAOM BR117]|uniref:Uncharacterized protein n=1 Tax=Spizellomyces punctatus (strain DAOM BR117) TaxID=645134 RepID=A0A0L0HAV0_SPIPD|nr:uncharacterized protein SPPG_09366 [Spizellomyces punctatus DAOM BR117]KNC98700.1 hypothetical protein SPPG_09366 [Spizellomyces punctatus DAOM BR117]|eukprot:XP_016606740.1 hypothetical protein SPPG_09366 [Spizellomyces punctatus DAOM BR117]
MELCPVCGMGWQASRRALQSRSSNNPLAGKTSKVLLRGDSKQEKKKRIRNDTTAFDKITITITRETKKGTLYSGMYTTKKQGVARSGGGGLAKGRGLSGQANRIERSRCGARGSLKVEIRERSRQSRKRLEREGVLLEGNESERDESESH